MHALKKAYVRNVNVCQWRPHFWCVCCAYCARAHTHKWQIVSHFILIQWISDWYVLRIPKGEHQTIIRYVDLVVEMQWARKWKKNIQNIRNKKQIYGFSIVRCCPKYIEREQKNNGGIFFGEIGFIGWCGDDGVRFNMEWAVGKCSVIEDMEICNKLLLWICDLLENHNIFSILW